MHGFNGKVGSNLASEIGGMRQKDVVDAMKLWVSIPQPTLIQPKIIAALVVILMIFVLELYQYSRRLSRQCSPEYLHMESTFRFEGVFLSLYNVTMMFVKAFNFSFIPLQYLVIRVTMSKVEASNSANASTQAVVYSNILILLFRLCNCNDDGKGSE